MAFGLACLKSQKFTVNIGSTVYSYSLQPTLQWLRRNIQRARKGLRISSTLDLGILYSRPDLLILFLRDLNLQRANIVVKVLGPCGARNRDDIVSLSHQPSQDELRRCAPLAVSHVLDAVHKLEVLVEILLGEPRGHRAEITLLKVIRRPDTTREETPAKRRVCDGGDTQLAARAEQVDIRRLDLEREGRVLDLHGVDVRDFAGAAEALGAALAQAEVAHLAGVLQLLHLGDGRLDGLVHVQAVAIIQVHIRQAQALKGFVNGLVDVLRLVAQSSFRR